MVRAARRPPARRAPPFPARQPSLQVGTSLLRVVVDVRAPRRRLAVAPVDSRPGVEGGSVADSSRAATRSRTASTRLGMASAISRAASAASAGSGTRARLFVDATTERRQIRLQRVARVAQRRLELAAAVARRALVVVQGLLVAWSFSSHVARRCGPARPGPPGRPARSFSRRPTRLDHISLKFGGRVERGQVLEGASEASPRCHASRASSRALSVAPPRFRVPEPPDLGIRAYDARADALDLAGELARALDGRRLLGEGPRRRLRHVELALDGADRAVTSR